MDCPKATLTIWIAATTIRLNRSTSWGCAASLSQLMSAVASNAFVPEPRVWITALGAEIDAVAGKTPGGKDCIGRTENSGFAVFFDLANPILRPQSEALRER